ncbi:MAG: signal transduction histidine kinase [Candidatus Endobugula sp.]|jgi:signal transduction histidine kinase
MVNSVSFQTRARTIDHLGREQIADCPTAISELWKNAYDAYSHEVELHVFDGKVPVCALVDDGHGMSREDFETKWLTVGTESKATNLSVSEDDRDGLPVRPKQGQKGIGRLSCAALGKLLLLVSKRKDASFVAALLDWRLFENPFLMLHDIYIPVIEFNQKEELFELMPDLFEGLMGNIWGDVGNNANKERSLRIEAAWDRFDAQEVDEDKPSTKSLIEKTIIGDAFDIRHLSTWSVWLGESTKGTAMFMADLHDDVLAQLSKVRIDDAEATEKRARTSFIQTLSNFTDPFAREGEVQINDFSNSVIAWHGDLQNIIISSQRDFSLSDLEDLEHLVEGDVDEEGFFRGRVKAFGIWHENVVVKPGAKYKMRKDSYFGAFSIRLGSYEAQLNSTTLSDGQYAHFKEQCDRYSGLMIYRDGLRVMPYGREDSDYFEIERRRTLHAGRYFWSNRRTFGRIFISRDKNPNLKDKAGREGLLDNRASKLFRDIVEKILVDIADNYMGGKSPDRKPIIKDIKATKNAEKAELDKKKLLIKEQRRVKSTIKSKRPSLEQLTIILSDLADEFSDGLHLDDEESAIQVKQKIAEYTREMGGFSLSPLPKSLGSAKDPYKEYRDFELRGKELLKQLDASVNFALSRLVTTSDYEVAQKTFNSKAGQLQHVIRGLAKSGKEILREETQSFDAIVSVLNKAYHQTMSADLEDLKLGKTTLGMVLDRLDDEYAKQEIEVIQKLKPYVTALENIKQKIDLEGLAIHSINEMEKWKEEAGRIHQLAQLGITVEIIGHEIEGLDMTINQGLKALKRSGLDDHQTRAYESIVHAQESLNEKWRFLSPLKLSGDRTRIEISGQRIFSYIKDYFGDVFERRDIGISATVAFLTMSINEQPARLFPVFINLVNNSQYWVGNGEEDKSKIILDFRDGEVVIADNGPGVDQDDYDQLFTLFFTRKLRGGRGVGLYLCKQNLQAGGHKIRYETNDDKKILSGANFAITLKGISNV